MGWFGTEVETGTWAGCQHFSVGGARPVVACANCDIWVASQPLESQPVPGILFDGCKAFLLWVCGNVSPHKQEPILAQLKPAKWAQVERERQRKRKWKKLVVECRHGACRENELEGEAREKEVAVTTFATFLLPNIRDLFPKNVFANQLAMTLRMTNYDFGKYTLDLHYRWVVYQWNQRHATT